MEPIKPVRIVNENDKPIVGRIRSLEHYIGKTAGIWCGTQVEYQHWALKAFREGVNNIVFGAGVMVQE